jgi:uncharacterized cupredoxin-like copper-binding protein
MTTSAESDSPFFRVAFPLVLAYLLGIGVIVAVAIAVAPGGSGSTVASKPATTVAVKLTEFKIDGDLMASAGHVKLAVTNAGTVDHNLTVGDGKVATRMLHSGETQEIDLGDLPAGDVPLFCSVAGHKDSGMSASLMVMAGASTAHGSSDASAAAGSSDAAPDYAKMDADMMASFKAFPAATEGVGNQPLAPTVLPDGTKQFELTAQIGKWEVEPGRVVDAWTYNGTVPAPMIKVNVGDRIRVLFHNKLPVSQDIHWHGIQTPFAMDGVAPITQEPVAPGGDFTYEFTVDHSYQGMYHPHLHGQMAVPNGMWGVFQAGDTPLAKGVNVDGIAVPADVKPTVDMPMVLNDSGVIGFSLNGKSFPATAPIVVKEGDWVALTYYNEGQQAHPMHLHQFPQLVVAEDGFKLSNPYWVDTLLIAPGQRYTVMFHADKKGTWAFHCHILNHAERDTGMFGMVTAVVVQ